MRPRQTIIESFSTFVQFDADRFQRWAIDPKLRRSMQSCLAAFPPQTTENFWAYWYKAWQNDLNILLVNIFSGLLTRSLLLGCPKNDR